ncbi:MAG: ABC transporter ATP-binding protein [Chitinophagales bacterium]|jgi:ABC-type multidrug transport system ATPase subunit|nr:ABC transporter ATP-binding protein [Chitinophagales bacterium]
MAQELAIQLKNLSKQYKHITAVNDLSLTVNTGEIFGFLGPNGAGKSTTIRMMLSLITPTKGDVIIFGKQLAKERNAILANIGCIIEKPDFYLYLSAKKNLELFARMNGLRPSASKLEEMFDLVGLTGRSSDSVKTYSHGMKQRLGLAQALIHEPALIVLDEPTTGLDPQGIIDLRNLILRLKNEFGKTIVLSSHILSEMELIADSMVIINKGKAVVQGKVAELLSNEDLIVRFEVSDTERAKSEIGFSQWNTFFRNDENGRLFMQISKDEIPLLNSFLVEKGVSVSGITYQRSLEDYFLKLTHQV